MRVTKPKNINKTATQIEQEYQKTIAKIDKQIDNNEKLILKLRKDIENLRNKKLTVTAKYLKEIDDRGIKLPPLDIKVEHDPTNLGEY